MHELAYNLFNVIALYGLPLVIITASYSLILWQISKKTRQSKSKCSFNFKPPPTNSPNASRSQDWRVKIQTLHSPVWRVFFPSHVPFLHIFGQLFSELASENPELLASLASVLKNLFTPLTQIACF
jgi:hypothetical protein